MQEIQEMWVQSLAWEDFLEEEIATHSNILAWRILWTEEPGGLQSIVSRRVRHDWSILAHTNTWGWGKPMQNNAWRKIIAFEGMAKCSANIFPWTSVFLALLFTFQFSSVQSLSRVRLCDPMNHSMPGLPVHHQLPESTQTHVHRVSDAIQPSHPLSSPSPPAPNPSQHQSLFQLASVIKVANTVVRSGLSKKGTEATWSQD